MVLHTPAVGDSLFVAAVDMRRAAEEQGSPAEDMPAAVVGSLAAVVVDILAA